MSDRYILEVREVSKTYRNGAHELTVLRGADFDLEEGATCSVVGPSGSGKTTLLGLCAGLDLPSSGEVRIAGREISTLGEDARAALRNKLVGFVFQNFQLMPTLTALENVMVPLELQGSRKARVFSEELLEKVGLEDRMEHYPTQLSGGEQQRVALARAFSNRPRVLFADEPTGNLDGETSSLVIDMLFELNRQAGTALVLVTHDLELARLTDRVIRLRDGEMVEGEESSFRHSVNWK